MIKPYIPPPKGDPDFPAMYWNPEDGSSRVFNKLEDVPTGWIDTHPNDRRTLAKPTLEAPVKAPTMTREEIIAAMNDGGIEYKKNAPTAALYTQLVVALKAVLEDMGKEFDQNADAKALLELLPKPE